MMSTCFSAIFLTMTYHLFVLRLAFCVLFLKLANIVSLVVTCASVGEIDCEKNSSAK